MGTGESQRGRVVREIEKRKGRVGAREIIREAHRVTSFSNSLDLLLTWMWYSCATEGI